MIKLNAKAAFFSCIPCLRLFIASLLVVLLCIPAMVSAQIEDPLHSITKAELRDQIFFLASDELKGRDKKKIDSLLFTRGFMSPVYHNPRDDAETLIFDKIEKATRFLYLVLVEAGNWN